MSTPTAKFLLWAPGILGLLFAAFISIFALDVFDGRHSVGETALALLLHLIPTFLLLALLALCWRWPWVGAIAFPALGVLYVVSSWGRLHWSAHVLIGGPLCLLGLLFLLSWCLRPARQSLV